MNVYRPQWMSSAVSNFVDELSDADVTTLFTDNDDDVVLCGDVSCPGTDDSSVDGELADSLLSLGLKQVVTEAGRHLLGSAAHLLDVFAVS